MIFAIYNYEEYHNENKDKWPIQPPTQEAWNEMVNSDMRFCETITADHLPDNVQPCMVAYNHPYKMLQAEKRTYEYALLLIEKLKKCVADPSLVKYEFNASANKYSILSNIERLLSECPNMPKVDLTIFN